MRWWEPEGECQLLHPSSWSDILAACKYQREWNYLFVVTSAIIYDNPAYTKKAASKTRSVVHCCELSNKVPII